jgi:hypothetical protein
MRGRLLAVLVTCAAAFGARAQSATVDLIIQFRQPAASSSRITTQAIATRREALDTDLAALRSDLAHVNIRRTYHRVLLGASIRVPREMVPFIQALPYVASVHEDRVYRALWSDSVSHINADKAWAQFGTRGAGVKIAVIDSGIDYRHPALGGGIGPGFKVVGGWDFVDDDADPIDTFGHGTHVAGIIAANGGGLLGVAPEASLIAYRALGNQGSGSASDVIAAIERCVDPDQNGDPSDHVDIVNLSLGGPALDDDPGAAAVETATAAGILFCIAAGNTGDYGNVQTPGIAPSAITAGASGEDDAVAAFSSRGPSLLYGLKPEIVAPGVKIRSSFPNNGIAELSGTSMATPHVAGVAALVKAVHHGWSPADIKNAIVTTAVLLDGDGMVVGAGRLDALSATTVNTLASPPVLSFGHVDVTKPVWEVKQTVTLRNLSAQAQTLTANVHGLRDGVVLTATPSPVVVAAGASQTVEVALSLTNAAVTVPDQGSLSLGGRIDWTGGAVPIHVPWAFVKGTFLGVRITDSEKDIVAEVLGSKRKYDTGVFRQSAHVLWPMESVDVVAVETGQSIQPERIVVAEQVDTGTTTQVAVRMADAQFTIGTDVTDETGGPLASGERQCMDQFVLAFPQGKKFAREQLSALPARFGLLSARVKLYLASHCADLATSTLYTSIHPSRVGLNGSFTSTLHPQWTRHDVRFEGEVKGFLTNAYPSVRIPGPESTYFFANPTPFIMRSAPSHLTIYAAPGSESDVDLVTGLERKGLCNRVETGGDETVCDEIGYLYLYLNDREARADGELHLDVSPMAYRAAAGTPLRFVTGAIWPHVILVTSPDFFQADATWGGPLNETRSFEAQPLPRTTMRDETGTRLGFESPYGFVFSSTALPPGAYRIDAVNSQPIVAGLPSTTTATALFDTRRSDGLFPQFTGLRIIDADGLPASALASNAAASMVFSVADHRRDGDAVRRVPPRDAATRVDYRAHGTGEWRPLAPLVEARQYLEDHLPPEFVVPGAINTVPFSGVGTMYRVDLSSLTRDLRGSVDIRVHAEDDAGNAIEMLLEPALVVTENPRRRSVSH